MSRRYPLAVAVAAIFFLSISSCRNTSGPEVYHFVDTSAFENNIKPGDDFFRYANGKWMDTVRILPTESGVGSFFDLLRSTNHRLQTTLDSLSKSSNPTGSIEQKVGDMYASGMDSAAIDRRGIEPVRPFLQQIDSIRNTRDVMRYVVAEQRRNDNLLFSMGVGSDDRNSRMNIAGFAQGGLGLPDRDYYFKKDSPTLAVVATYKDYIRNLFVLAGDDPTTASQKTEKVYGVEKELAISHRTSVELRDPISNYHKMAVAALDRSMPSFAWKNTLEGMGIHVDSVIVRQPGFYTKLDQLLRTVPPDTWKAYLRIHTLRNYSNRLSGAFVNAQFQYARAISGQQQLKPRSERMVEVVDATLGEALGQIYVKKYFSPAAKQRMIELVDNLQKAFAARIDKLDWMSDSTKVIAKEKLMAFLKKIGYPDKWRSYDRVKIDRDHYFENRLSADKNDYEYELAKVGKPVDRSEWTMTPPTINAYYNPYFNEIVFPAGILQVPFFNPDADDAVNYGGIGMAIGHEMTHGFDDQGSQYDKDGNLKNWWGKEDSMKFSAKTKSMIALYNSFTVLDTMHVNGALTNGENIADLGGLAIAYDAFKLTPEGKDSTPIDGFTPDQRFFLSFARIWRIRMKDQLVRTLVNINEHSPEKWRVNGPLMNFPPFYAAFNVQPGQKMYRSDSIRITIW